MRDFLPLLSFAGIFLGFLFWSPIARGIAGSALLRGPQPVSDGEGARRLKAGFLWMAAPWFTVFGILDAWFFFAPGAGRGWFWLFLGVSSVPVIAGVTFAAALHKARTSSDTMRSHKSLERTREE